MAVVPVMEAGACAGDVQLCCCFSRASVFFTQVPAQRHVCTPLGTSRMSVTHTDSGAGAMCAPADTWA